MITKELVIIGGGPAGMSAAVAAYESGIRDILILERDCALGGILRQCIHNGFGLHRFGEELTGPEYAWRYEKQVRELEIPFKLNTMVLDITPDKVVTATNIDDGIFMIQAKAIILAMGCRERPKGALNIAGDRPAGIFSAGMAQKLVNMKGYIISTRPVVGGGRWLSARQRSVNEYLDEEFQENTRCGDRGCGGGDRYLLWREESRCSRCKLQSQILGR